MLVAAAGRSITSSSTTTRSSSQKKGVAVPEDLRRDDRGRRKAAPTPRTASTASSARGLKNANMTLWTNFFLNYGGEFLDAKGNILTDGPRPSRRPSSTSACSTRPRPPGVAGFNWMECAWPRSCRARAGDVDRRRRLGAAAGRPGPPRASSARSATAWCRPDRRANTRRPMATASASPRRARTRKPPICSASGWSRSSRARGCCRPAGGVPFRNSILERCRGRRAA